MIKWIIQKTLAGEQTLNSLIKAIEEHGSRYELIEVIPFDTQIRYQQKDDSFPIIYGSSTFMFGSMEHEYLKQGVFYDPDTFSMSVYLRRWQEHMLNADGTIVAAGKITELDFEDSQPVFVRPDSDSKSFSGDLYEFGDLKHRFGQLNRDNPFLDQTTLVMLACPKEIEKEWRCFIVAGAVVSACRYRVAGQLFVSREDVPAAMLEFCEAMCRIYQPHDIFVMDVALYMGSYRIIECNCFNGSGIYDHDWSVIVGAVETFIAADAGD